MCDVSAQLLMNMYSVAPQISSCMETRTWTVNCSRRLGLAGNYIVCYSLPMTTFGSCWDKRNILLYCLVRSCVALQWKGDVRLRLVICDLAHLSSSNLPSSERRFFITQAANAALKVKSQQKTNHWSSAKSVQCAVIACSWKLFSYCSLFPVQNLCPVLHAHLCEYLPPFLTELDRLRNGIVSNHSLQYLLQVGSCVSKWPTGHTAILAISLHRHSFDAVGLLVSMRHRNAGVESASQLESSTFR